MKIYAEGRIDADLIALGARLSPVYLFQGSKQSAIFDAGTSMMGPVYKKSVMQVLGDAKRLNYLFLTHSHWDHCGAMTYLNRAMPEMMICGHSSIQELMNKESVINKIRLFNEMLREANKAEIAEDTLFDGVDFNLLLKDGDRVDLGNSHCIAYETPGHTKDSMSYFIPEYELLFPGESIGVPEGKNGDGVQVEFLNSYNDYLDSIQRMAALKPKILCMAHEWVFTDDDAAAYFEKSFNETILYRAAITRYLDDANGDIDAAVELMAKKEYDEKGTIYQPRYAYITNLKVQIKHIADMIVEQRADN